MTKVFKKIRQGLLHENKFSKYLLYAIGEIVLVVIGILLALQINNWNETTKRNAEEAKLLIALIEDFKENKDRIKEAIRKEEDVIQTSRSLIQAMQSKNTIHKDSIRFWVASGAKSWWRAEFVTGTYDAIVSSGKIAILKNENLKRLLSQFTADINAGFEDHNESMSYLIEMNKISADVTPALIHDVELEKLGITSTDNDFGRSIEKLINNDVYLGLLISKTWLETLRIDYQQKLQGYIDEIIAICESELTK
ncbi:hypothetical protein MTsPCn5_17930 [Croceitalea sp. MTPC5]|uniref:DUF6090 family protein n=1 Tax=Croceitalea sp. MTPC5 TaxID=3056565 RepID=UPI002B3C8996|nr:hypothetical protein MTsPCn5_17930 [Croceitalea sp. MTPC5]